MFPALKEVFEDNDEELSARASGAVGGGLALFALGGLNGPTWVNERNQHDSITKRKLSTALRVAQHTHTHTHGYRLTISLIPISFPAGSFGLEEGRGGGTRAPVVSGVVGLFGAGITQRNTFVLLEEVR